MSQAEEPNPMGDPFHLLHWGLFGESHTKLYPSWPRAAPLSHLSHLSLPHLPATCTRLSLSLDSALKGR